MNLVSIEKDELESLLAKAYDSGWYGAKELKDSVAKQLLDDFLGHTKEEKPKEAVGWTINLDGSSEMVTIDVDQFRGDNYWISTVDADESENWLSSNWANEESRVIFNVEDEE